MAETLTLTTPISISGYQVQKIVLNWKDAIIKIAVEDNEGEEFLCGYNGPEATTLMTQLNKIDLSTNSLHKRILERLVTDGQLPPGTVTGTPD